MLTSIQTIEAHQLLDVIFEFYGCQKCRLCCRAYTPAMQKIEIERISRYLRTKPKKFRRKYLVKINIPFNEYEMKAPCPFLKDYGCSIYPLRPGPCRLFPFELSSGGLVRMISIEVCPTATLIYNDFLDFHDKFKHLSSPMPKEKGSEITRVIGSIEKMIVEKRKELDLPREVSGFYVMAPIIQFYFFYLYRIAKVKDAEEIIRNYYEKQDVKK